MSLFNQLGQSGVGQVQKATPQTNPMQMFQRFRQNPMQFLMQQRFNVPQSMANDPNAILNHLVSSGQIQQSQVDAARQMMGRMTGKQQNPKG